MKQQAIESLVEESKNQIVEAAKVAASAATAARLDERNKMELENESNRLRIKEECAVAARTLAAVQNKRWGLAWLVRVVRARRSGLLYQSVREWQHSMLAALRQHKVQTGA